eukprot:TRINITY_DN29636_c0_g1_i1.p1 TRINITY_DN29636_c0_g1~~TRINITY_DN29636_c0_g1_i1.p1  ORF type:complete len:702 (+),score=170.70 TRINITY_DN29636_c0_g1_i1:36-2141(+)
MIEDDIIFSSGDEAAAGMLFTGGNKRVAAGKAPVAKPKKGVTKRQRGDSVLGMQKKRKVEPLARKVDVGVLFSKYKPVQESELVTSTDRNTKALSWMRDAVAKPYRRSKVLFIYGPSGSGKRTLVEYAAKASGAAIRRWINTDTNYHGGEEAPTTALDYFTRALLYDRRPSSELIKDNTPHDSTVMVFEGLPWCPFVDHKQQLFAVLQRFAAEISTPSFTGYELPVVFIFTVHNTHSTTFQLHKEYPDEFLNSHFVQHLVVHPVTEKQLKKRLTHIATKEHFSKQQAASLVDKVMTYSMGDIRQAIHDLAFNMIQPSIVPRASQQLNVRQGVRLDDKSDEVANHTTLDIGHATARVLAAKRDADGRLEHPLPETLKRLPVGADRFIGFIHHSLPRYCQVDDGLERMTGILRRMSEGNVYSNYLCAQDRASGWTSSCLLSWSVDKHMHAPPPSRANKFEQCHPPPLIQPLEAQIVLKKVITPSIDVESRVYYSSESICLDLCPMVGKMVFKHRNNSPLPLAAGRAIPTAPQPSNRPTPFVPSSGPQPFVPSSRPQPFVPPSSKPVPFRPNAPVPFVPSNKPVPFVPSNVSSNKPVPFVPSNVSNKPVPFLSTMNVGAAKPPVIRLTNWQVMHLGGVMTYSSGVWQPKIRTSERLQIAGKWVKPRCTLNADSLLDSRVLIDKHEEVVVEAVEDPSDPIEDFQD